MKEVIFFSVALEHMLLMYVVLRDVHSAAGIHTFQKSDELVKSFELGLIHIATVLEDIIEDLDDENIDDYFSEFVQNNRYLVDPDLMARKIKQRMAMRMFDEDSI